MRRTPILFFVAALSCSLVACGGGGSGDDDDDDVGDDDDDGGDDEVTPDAAPTVSGIGQECDPMAMASTCPASAPACVQPNGAVTGYCSMPCATTADTATLPDAAAHQMCGDEYNGSATAACLLATDDGGEVEWLCAVVCGTVGATMLGECDAPFTCEQPNAMQNGFCL